MIAMPQATAALYFQKFTKCLVNLLDMYLPKHDLRCAIASCELRCAVASCHVPMSTHFGETCNVRA